MKKIFIALVVMSISANVFALDCDASYSLNDGDTQKVSMPLTATDGVNSQYAVVMGDLTYIVYSHSSEQFFNGAIKKNDKPARASTDTQNREFTVTLSGKNYFASIECR
jgi:hypothetical protein